MGTSGERNDTEGRPAGPAPGEGLVYVAPANLLPDAPGKSVSLRELWLLVWRRKLIVAAVTAVFALGSITYALLADEVYRAEVLLAPAEEASAPAIGGQLGGLAALAGFNVNEGGGVEALAVLRSRDFAREFIEHHALLPLFFEDDWDQAGQRWRMEDPEAAPDVRDGVRFFHEKVLTVQEERGTGLVTLAVEWTDPEIAAEWAGTLVRRLNNRLRERALAEAQTNIDYLQSELATTSLVTLQESIGRLLESELQKLMLARGNEEFAFTVLDPAEPPKHRVRPKRTAIVILGTILGGLLAVFSILIVHAGRAGAAR